MILSFPAHRKIFSSPSKGMPSVNGWPKRMYSTNDQSFLTSKADLHGYFENLN